MDNKVRLKELKIKESMQFRMANDFVSRCHWSIKLNNVGKMILFFISSIDYEKEEEIVRSCVPGKELAEYMGIKETGWANSLRRAAAAARKEIIDIPCIAENGKTGWYVSGWVNHVKYNPDTQNVEWEMDGNLKPFFYAVRERLNKITGKSVGYIEGVTVHCMRFKHAYSFRVYVLAEQLKGVGGKEFTIEEFADLLKLPKSYKVFGNLKQKVLDYAKEDINKYSDIDIDIITDRPGYKRSNKIVKFFLKCSGKVEALPVLPDVIPKEDEDPLKAEARTKLEYYGVYQKVIQEFLINYEIEYIISKISDCEARFVEASVTKPVKDSKKAGYIVSSIKSNYDDYLASKDRIQKLAAEKAEKERQMAEEQAEKERQRIAEQEQAEARQKENDDIVSKLSPDQKARIVELVKNGNKTVAMAIKDRTFDDLYCNNAYSGLLMDVYRKHFAEQPNLWDETVDINELAK